MSVPQRRYQLARLRQELAAAGFAYAGLTSEDGTVYGYDAQGQRQPPLPPAALAVVAAHDPTRRSLSAEQLQMLQRFRAARDAATFAAFKPAALALLWLLLKRAAGLQDGEEEATS